MILAMPASQQKMTKKIIYKYIGSNNNESLMIANY